MFKSARCPYRIFSFLLILSLLCQSVPAHAAGGTITDVSYADGIIEVTLSGENDNTVSLTLYMDGAAIYMKTAEAEEGRVQIPLPVRNLPLGSYTASVSCSGDSAGSRSLTIVTGTESPVAMGGSYHSYTPQTPATSRAVMVPYAKVFASDSMTGEPLAELKRHDLVSILSDNGSISHVKCIIQSGNGSITNIDNTNAEYHSADDLVVTGYMYNTSFSLPSTGQEPDLQREVAELAYTRLGLKGVYSQARRYIDYYTDCSALASWCWYQVGIDFTNFGTACNGIAAWADSQTENVILWDGAEENATPQADFASYKAANGIMDDLYFTGSFDGTLPETSIVSYMQAVDQSVFAALEPGDLIFFNYYRDITDQYGGSFRYQVNEDLYGRTSMGYDHVAIFIGARNSSTITVIEASSPSSDPGQNTRISDILLSSDRAGEIVKIIRPVGCTQIDPLGVFSSSYSGAYYADIGSLSSPVPGLTAATKRNIINGSRFGYRTHPLWNTWKLHTGIDLGGNVRATYGTEVSAALDGEVVFISNTCSHNYGKSSSNCCNCGGGYGNYVIIQHSDTTKTIYAHLQAIDCSIGQTVSAGDAIGEVGSTGYSSGAHLHFEVQYNGVPTDPLQYIS